MEVTFSLPLTASTVELELILFIILLADVYIHSAVGFQVLHKVG